MDARLVVSKVDRLNAAAWRDNKERGRVGDTNCGLSGRRAKLDERRDGFLPIGVSKARGPIGYALSPFNLSTPPDMTLFATRDGLPTGQRLPTRTLELVWQAAKVKRSELTADGQPSTAYFHRRERIYDKGVVKRSYFSKKEIAGAVLGWRASPIISWVPSRKFYASAYARVASTTPEFQFLAAAREDGWNLLLGGPDGWPIGDVAQASPSVHDVAVAYASTAFPFGHERVLVAMLLGLTPWSEYPDVCPS